MRHVARATERDGGAAVGLRSDGPHCAVALAVASAPLPEDHAPDPLREGAAPTDGGRLRAERLADLLGRPDAYGGMNVEFKLFVRLLVVEGGRMAGTWDEIGGKLATDGRNARSWAGKLQRSGKATVADKGRKWVEIVLEEPYLGVATAADRPELTAAARPAQEDDPDLVVLLRTYATAKATGSAMEVTTRRTFGDAKAR